MTHSHGDHWEKDPNAVPGIKPEDTVSGSDPEFQGLLQEASSEPQIDLHDSEIMKAGEVLAHLSNKYSHRPATFENLTSLKNEADDLFEKIGLQVQVDWVQSALSVTPQPPTITIVGRLTPFDPERQQHEVRTGVADSYWDTHRRKQN